MTAVDPTHLSLEKQAFCEGVEIDRVGNQKTPVNARVQRALSLTEVTLGPQSGAEKALQVPVLRSVFEM